MSYVIRNCPNLSHAIMADGTERNFQCGLEIDKYCQDCTDCVMKQIVELCKENLNSLETYVDVRSLECVTLQNILQLLDIQEVE